MNEAFAVAGFYLELANLVLAVFLMRELFYAMRACRVPFFSRIMKTIFGVACIFIVIVLTLIFGTFPEDMEAVLLPVATIMFLLLLIYAIGEMKKSVLAHEHLMRRKMKQKISDVE